MKKSFQLSITAFFILSSVFHLQMHDLHPMQNFLSEHNRMNKLNQYLPSSKPIASICLWPGSPVSQLRLKQFTLSPN